MPKRDPCNLQPPPFVVFDKPVPDPYTPDQGDFTIRFRYQSDMGVTTKREKLAKYYIDTFVTGIDGTPPLPLDPVGTGELRKEVTLSEDLCNIICMMMEMEWPVEGEEKWTFRQWAGLTATRPAVFQTYAEECFKLVQLGEEAGKNSPSPVTV